MVSKLYPLRTQLNSNSGTQGDDCGPVTIINVIKWASDNNIAIHQSQVGMWVRRIRDWANKPTGGLLLAGDCLQVYENINFKKLFYDIGYHAPEVNYQFRKSWYDSLAPKLRGGQMIHLGVDYGVLRDGRAPTASSTFRGGHYLCLLNGGVNSHGDRMVWDGDPLFDGRRDYPKGWQKTRLAYIKAAAAEWGAEYIQPGYNKASFIAIKKGGPR